MRAALPHPFGAPRCATFALVTLAVLAGPTSPAQAQPAMPPPVREVAVSERIGAAVPADLRFTDSTGRTRRLGEYFQPGTPVVLSLTYNRCAMLCSLVLRGTMNALAALDEPPGTGYRALNVSIDPRETVHEAARAQTTALEAIGQGGEPERWPFLTGEREEIRALADSLGFGYAWDERTEQFAHPAVIFVLDGHGRVARYLYGIEFDADELAAALDDARSGAPAPGTAEAVTVTATSAGQSGVAALLSCFRFEAAARIFGASIERCFQVGGVLIFAALSTMLALQWRRERRRRRPPAGGRS